MIIVLWNIVNENIVANGCDSRTVPQPCEYELKSVSRYF